MTSNAIRAIVADDEPLARRRIRSLLSRQADFKLVAEAANGPETVTAVDEHRPEVLFLDVAMPGLTELQVLDEIGVQAVPVVVFVTAYDEHAVQAFDHHALDYVLKPIDEQRFERTLDRIRERLIQRKTSALTDEVLRLLAQNPSVPSARAEGETAYPARIMLKLTHKITFVAVADIEWVEAEGDYVRLHTRKTSHLYRSTLSSLEQRLDPREFVRIHRSTIVRWSRVKELQPYFRGEYIVTLHDGRQLKLSRSYQDRLQEMLGQQL